MRPEYIAAWTAAPRGNVAPADGWSRSRTFPIDYEQIIGARLHAELRRPAITDAGEFGAETTGDALGAGRENPGTVVLKQPLGDGGGRPLCPQGSARPLRPGGIGPRGHQPHPGCRPAKRPGHTLRGG